MDGEKLRQYPADNLVDTSEATEILSCFRQNITDLIKRGKLIQVYSTDQIRMFLRDEIMACRKQVGIPPLGEQRSPGASLCPNQQVQAA